MTEEIPLWKQGLTERLEAYSTGPEPDRPSSHSSDPVTEQDEMRKALRQVADNTLAQKFIPSAERHDSQNADEQQVFPLSDAPDPGTTRKLGFGFTKGKEEFTLWNNLNDYLMVEHPELATRTFASRRGMNRKAWEEVAAKRGETYEDIPWFEEAVGNLAKDLSMSFTQSIVKWFGTEEEQAQFEDWVAEKKFGKGWMEKSPDERRALIANDTKNLLSKQFPDVYGTVHEDSKTAMIGEIGGAIADPTTLAIPAGKTYTGVALLGGSVGASDATLYDLAKTGTIDPAHVAAGAAFGAALGPALKFLGGKVSRFITKKADSRTANKVLKKYEESVLRSRKAGVSKDFAHNAARVEWGLTTDAVNDLYKIAGRTFDDSISPAAARAELEMRASWLQKNRFINKLGKQMDRIITPVSTRMAKFSSKIAHQMKVNDAATHIRTHLWFNEVNGFIKQVHSMGSKDMRIMKQALSNGDNATITKLVRQYAANNPKKFGNMMQQLKQTRKTLREIHKVYKNMGYNMEYVEGYFPRIWKDPAKMGDIEKGLFSQRVINRSKELGRPLTSAETKEIISGILHAPIEPKAKATTAGALRERKIQVVPDELLDFYADPMEALHSYIRAASHDIERAAFFKKFGYKGKLMTDGTDLDSRLHDVVAAERKRLGWTGEETDEVLEILRARFYQGEMSPGRFVQTMKNVGYSTTLGNPISALTQLGDQAFAMYKVGIRGAAVEAVRGMRGKRLITKMDLGLSDAVEELYANTTKAKRTLNTMLKWSGFNKMDQFGKENIINGVLRKYQKQVKSQKGMQKFAAKWGQYFENETAGLMSDLKKGRMTDNVKMLMWHELSDVQPIALSEMPEMYLRHPNGRLFYMLKTFTVKQIDFMRREILRQFKQGHYAKGTKNLVAFTGFWLLANGVADASKEALVGMFGGGADFDIADNAVENMLQLVVWSRYMGAQTMREGPGGAAMDFLFPPTNYIDNVFLGVTQGDLPKALEPVPIVGKLIYKAARKQEKRAGQLRRRGAVGSRDRFRSKVR